jgi:hypothetical protein
LEEKRPPATGNPEPFHLKAGFPQRFSREGAKVRTFQRKIRQNGKDGFNGFGAPRPIAARVNQASTPENNLAKVFRVISRAQCYKGLVARRQTISAIGKFLVCDLLRHPEPHFHSAYIQGNVLRFGRALA